MFAHEESGRDELVQLVTGSSSVNFWFPSWPHRGAGAAWPQMTPTVNCSRRLSLSESRDVTAAAACNSKPASECFHLEAKFCKLAWKQRNLCKCTHSAREQFLFSAADTDRGGLEARQGAEWQKNVSLNDGMKKRMKVVMKNVKETKEGRGGNRDEKWEF